MFWDKKPEKKKPDIKQALSALDEIDKLLQDTETIMKNGSEKKNKDKRLHIENNRGPLRSTIEEVRLRNRRLAE